MGRKTKAHDARRNEILDGAWKLFTQHGYEGATVAAIIDALGISKGTFYHYFQSKEQVLDAITDRLGSESLRPLQRVVEDLKLGAGAKLDRFLIVSRESRLRRIGVVLKVARVLYLEENLIIRHKIGSRFRQLTLPMLIHIIAQGIEERVFQLSNAEEAANFVLLLSDGFADQQMRTLLGSSPPEQKVASMVARAEFAVESLERILGMSEKTLTRPNEQLIRQFVNAAQQEES